ncbi:MAG: ABC transporter permease [Bacteroidales bacterium]|nr:ABC transporter permease [Bacteroidales bacterium]MCF8338586.1 ABC transporter permease [Bacteroidales bacterium]
MGNLIRIELFKIFSKGRTYIGFAAIALIVVTIQIGIYFEGREILDFAIQHLKENFVFEGNLINAYLITHIILNSLFIHIPFLIALVTGDLLAGEANSGTFRLLLTRPVSRTKLLTSKFISGWIYTMSLLIFMLILSLGVGLAIFGTGDLIVLKSTINIFSSDDVLWRFASAYGFGIITMTAVAALSFMLSAFSDNSIGPIIGTVAIIIGITVISTIGFTLMEPVNPYLFTNYLTSWKLFFEHDINTVELTRAIIVELTYIVVFLGTTFVYFNRKDILS